MRLAPDPRRVVDETVVAAGRHDAPFGLYSFRADEPGAELARQVEGQVFLEVFGNTPELLAAEYGPYEARSVFLCVFDHQRRVPAGVMRLILPSPAGLKTFNDIAAGWHRPVDQLLTANRLDLPARQVWDIATLAVTPEYRGAATNGLISTALYQGVIQLALARGVRWVLAILDLVVLDLIQTTTGQPFSRFAGLEPMRYLDSPSSLPVYCDLHDYGSRLSIIDPALHEIFFRGRGLEAAVSLPSWDQSAPSPTELDQVAAG